MANLEKKEKRPKQINLIDLAERIQILKSESESNDIVARAGLLGLPLVLGKDNGEDFNFAFQCALAELSVCYERSYEDLRLILSSHFSNKTLHDHFYDQTTRRLNLLISNQKGFTLLDKKRIIGIAYPWFNPWMYLDFARIARIRKLKITHYDDYAGSYRYFRSYPENSSKFKMSDGYVSIRFDQNRNMIVFGQIARMCPFFEEEDMTDESNTKFEHRGFVVPTDGSTLTLISFREGVIRSSIIKLSHGSGSGIVLTTTRKKGRPFASKALITKEGSGRFYSLKIKVLDSKFLDPQDPQLTNISKAMEDLNKNNFPKWGWMWGDPDAQT